MEFALRQSTSLAGKLNIPRLLQDIIEVAAHEDRKQIAPYCKLLIRELGIHLSQLNAAEYVDYVARNARISPRTQREATVDSCRLVQVLDFPASGRYPLLRLHFILHREKQEKIRASCASRELPI